MKKTKSKEELQKIRSSKKYDWHGLKLEYLKGDEPSLSEFLRQKIGVNGAKAGNTQLHTAGWVEERKVVRQKAAQRAQQKILDDLSKTDEAVIQDAARAEKLLIEGIIGKIENNMVEDEITGKKYLLMNSKEQKSAFEILRIHQGKTSSESGVQTGTSLRDFLESMKNQEPSKK